MDIFILLLGIPIGVVGSLVAWWVLFHALVPSVEISSVIAKTPFSQDPSGYRYRIKMMNAGRRAILDVELVARLRIKGLFPSLPSNWEVLYPKCSYEKIPRVEPTARTKLWPALTIRIADFDDYAISLLPPPIQAKIRQRTILLEDLLSLGNKAELQLFVFGYDEFSGSRKLFASRPYSREAVREGYFCRHSLEIVESENEVDEDSPCVGSASFRIGP